MSHTSYNVPHGESTVAKSEMNKKKHKTAL